MTKEKHEKHIERCLLIGNGATAEESDSVVIHDDDGKQLLKVVNPRLSYILRRLLSTKDAP